RQCARSPRRSVQRARPLEVAVHELPACDRKAAGHDRGVSGRGVLGGRAAAASAAEDEIAPRARRRVLPGSATTDQRALFFLFGFDSTLRTVFFFRTGFAALFAARGRTSTYGRVG